MSTEMPISQLRVPSKTEWPDEDILHIIEIAAMFSFTGRLANAIELIANPEYALLGRRTN